ncbi:MAG: MerR family transcriptional regulator [Candidatus Omnitrophica bacterium]|nr:MerR family transcriptional regulator [Candidatus Omnitrophota bacterium]
MRSRRKNNRQTHTETATRYNLKQTAALLGVPYVTLRFWIKKGWVTPMLDYRSKPVFTEDGIQQIRQWRNALRPMAHA